MDTPVRGVAPVFRQEESLMGLQAGGLITVAMRTSRQTFHLLYAQRRRRRGGRVGEELPSRFYLSLQLRKEMVCAFHLVCMWMSRAKPNAAVPLSEGGDKGIQVCALSADPT